MLLVFSLIFALWACREPVALEGLSRGADTYADIDTDFGWGQDDLQTDSSVEPRETDLGQDTVTSEAQTDSDSSSGSASVGGCPSDAELVMAGPQNSFHGGTERALIFVEAATDFRCPYCASFAVLAEEIWSRRPAFQKYVRFYFQHYPLESLHPDAWDIHAMSVAVHNQDSTAFWRLHDTIYGASFKGSPMSLDEIETYIADELALDMERFQAGRTSDETLSFIAWSKARGKDAGVQGTPTVFVCGQKISWSKIEDEVDKYLLSK